MKTINATKVEHPLDEWLNFEQESISRFKQSHPDIWDILGSNINIARMIPFIIGQQENLTDIEVERLMMWQKVLHYQVQSLFLLLQFQLDAGFALLRLAAELSRDVARIADDKEMFGIWKNRDKKDQRILYQKHFKFHVNSIDEKLVKNIYDLCSRYGVHGHQTDSMFSEMKSTIDSATPLVLVGVSEFGALDAVHTWLLSFWPMQHLCTKTFISKHLSTIPDVFSMLAQMEVEMNKVLKNLSDTLASMKQSESSSR
jgi:hypothetical protein